MSAQRKERAEEENKDVLPVEGEEDLEEAMRKVASVDPARKKYELPNQQIIVNIPEVVDDFLRNFMRRAGLKQTVMVFEAEWADRKSLMTVTAKTGMSFIPDARAHREFLQSELDTVLRESETLRQEVLVAGERIGRMQKERGFNRLQYRRIVRDKNKLTEDIKQLKKHLESYEPTLRQLNDSYQTALRQKMLINLKKDKIQNASESRLKQENLQIKKETSIRGQSGTHKPSAKSPLKRLPKDAEFPFYSMKVSPPPAQVGCQKWKNPISFSLTCSIRAHKLPISCISLHPRKLILASASDDCSWRLWVLPAKGETVGQMLMTGEGHSDWLASCSFHPDGSKLATTSGDTTVRLWDFSLGCSMLTLSGHSQPTWGCSFHSCGQFLASCSADRTAKLWDLSGQRCLLTLRRHTASVNSVCFLPSSNLLLTCSADKTLALWDARMGVCTATFHGHQHPCNHAAFSLTSVVIASCDTQGVINLWDIRKPESAVATVDAGPLGANQVAFSPSGKMLVVACSDGLVRLAETDSCAVRILTRHSESVQGAIFAHTEETVVSAGSDGLVNVWSLQNE